MATDRTIRKQQEAGQLNAPASSTANSLATIAQVHTRAYCWTKSGNENSSNNVGEVAMFVINRAGLIKSAKLITNTNVAANATNGMVMTIAKRTALAPAAAVPVANYNTDTAAQGALVSWTAASFVVFPNTDASVAAGDVLTFKCTKFGTGSLLDSPSAVVVDVEEV